MKQLKIALTALAAESGISQENWKTVPLKGADLTDVSAVVMTSRDEIPAAYDTIHAFSIPLFILDTGEAVSRNMSEISGTLLPIKEKSSWKKRITRAALQYEKDLLPPFFGALMKYTSRKNDEYDSPGHQGGAFFPEAPCRPHILLLLRSQRVPRRPVQFRRGPGGFSHSRRSSPIPPRSTRPRYFMRTKPISS